MLAAPTPASPHWNPCDDDAVARETEAMTTALAGTLAEPPPSAANMVANAADGALNTRIVVAAASNRSIVLNISVLLIDGPTLRIAKLRRGSDRASGAPPILVVATPQLGPALERPPQVDYPERSSRLRDPSPWSTSLSNLERIAANESTSAQLGPWVLASSEPRWALSIPVSRR